MGEGSPFSIREVSPVKYMDMEVLKDWQTKSLFSPTPPPSVGSENFASKHLKPPFPEL